jgi:hypothetical protein
MSQEIILLAGTPSALDSGQVKQLRPSIKLKAPTVFDADYRQQSKGLAAHAADKTMR